MPRDTRGERRHTAWPALVLALAIPLLPACDSLLGSRAGLADRVEIRVTGTTTVPLLLVRSTNFTARRDPQTNQFIATLLSADTVVIRTLPHNQNESLRGRDRFLARLVNPDLGVTAAVLMEIELDGRLTYSQQATLRDASIEYLTYFDPR